MRLVFATLVGVWLSSTPVAAHFVFLLPPTEGRTVIAVLADRPAKDEAVEIGKIPAPTVRLVDVSGKTTTASAEPEAGGWRLAVGSGTVEVRATLEYGVVNRGEGHVIRLRHHARLLLGELAENKPGGDGQSMTLDLAPVKVTAGLAFRVTLAGKPLAGADVTVYEPGSDQLKVLKADADGLTAGFAKPGRYSARATHIDRTPGEFEGRKYAACHSYATATATVK